MVPKETERTITLTVARQSRNRSTARVNRTRLIEWTNFHDQVDNLPEEQRKVFDLLWYKGLTQPEAADVLGHLPGDPQTPMAVRPTPDARRLSRASPPFLSDDQR